MNAINPMDRNLAIRIVIAYEDFECAIHARQMSEHMAAQLKPGFEIASELWKFDFLRYAELREEAIRGALLADMIIIATQGGFGLPIHVRTWIENWLPQKQTSPAALVAMVGRRDVNIGERPSVCDYLQAVARRAGMDFYFKAGGRCRPDYELAGASRHQLPTNVPTERANTVRQMHL